MNEGNEIALYLLVGGTVTLADALSYGWLTGRERAVARMPANIISTTLAMVMGFSLHFGLVFRPQVALVPSRLLSYVLTVSCSAYVVQNLVIHFCAGRFRYSPALIPGIRPRLQNSKVPEWIDKMAGKALAAAAGMIWNFLFFKWVVYA